MAIGKEIKVTLSLDDSGFAVKMKGAGEAVSQLEKNLGSLTGQTGKTEAALADLSGSVKGFTEGFGALQKSLQGSIDNVTRAVANSFNQLAAQSQTSAKQAQDSATAHIDAKMRALKAEVETNRQLLEARGKMHAEMRKLESDERAKAMAAELDAENLRRGKKAGSSAAAAAKDSEAARYRANADVIKAEVAGLDRWVISARTAQATRNSLIASLETERKATLAANDAKRARAEIEASVGRSNAGGAAGNAREQANAVGGIWKDMADRFSGKARDVLKSSVDNAGAAERSKIMVQALNLPKNQENALFAQSAQISKELGFIPTQEVIKSQMSAISSLGFEHADTAGKTLPRAIQAAHNMEKLGYGSGDMQATLRKIYDVAGMRQQGDDADAMQRTFDLLNKLMVGSAGKASLDDVITALHGLGDGAATVSDEGLKNLVIATGQIKDAGTDASTVGSFIKLMQANATGKATSKDAIGAFAGSGVLGDKGVDLSKDGAGVFKQAKNADQWLNNPVKAMQAMIPQIVAYTRQGENKQAFYQGRDDRSVENQMLAVDQYLQRLGISKSTAQAVMSVSSPAAAEQMSAQSQAIDRADSVSQTAARLHDSFDGKMEEVSGQWKNFTTILGDTFLPVLKTVLEYASKLVIAMRDFAENHGVATAVSVIAASLGGAILSAQGFLSVFGEAGLMGAIRGFLGVAPQAAEGAGLMGAGFSKLGGIFKGLAAVMIAWDVGSLIGDWIAQFEYGGLTISQHVQNMFTRIEVGYKRLMLSTEEWARKARNFLHIDSDAETAEAMADIEKRRAEVDGYERNMIIVPDAPAAKKPVKPAAKAAPAAAPVTTAPANTRTAKARSGAANAAGSAVQPKEAGTASGEAKDRLQSEKAKALEKSEAEFNQAHADATKFVAGYGDKNKADRVSLLSSERERTAAQFKAAADKEDAEFEMHLATLKKTRDAEEDAISKSVTDATEKNAKMKVLEEQYQRDRTQIVDTWSERRTIREEQEQRALESAVDKLARQWQDTYKTLDDIGVSTANSFVNMISSSLSTGHLEIKKFIVGVLTEIANAKLKETLADPLKMAINAGMSWLGNNLFAGMGTASAGSAGTVLAAGQLGPAAVPALPFLSTFANGGIMTDMGPLELRKYANGGIATGPQLALYGEAGMNEAYVPLPDGRSIPVSMRTQGPSAPAAAPSVSVNVINQTGQQVNAQQGGLRFDGRQYVLDVVMTAAQMPGPFRNSMKEAMK